MTLFNNEAPAPVAPDNPAINGANEVEILKKRLADSQSHIKKLESETAEYRKHIGGMMSLEELYAKRTAEQPNNVSSSQVPQEPRGERESESAQRVTDIAPSKDDVAALVREALSMELTKAATQNNIKQTKEALEKAWGADYVQKLEARIQDLGLGKEFIDDVAGRSPKAVLGLLGIQEGSTQVNEAVNVRLQNPPQSRSSSSNLPVDNGPRGKSYYDNLRRTDPKRYLSPSVQIEMHNRAIAMGPKFFET